MDLLIERLATGDTNGAQAWDAYVMAHPEATFFHRAGWMQVMQAAFAHPTHFLQAREAETGALRGVLPLAHVRSRLFGTALTSLPFAVYGGVLADDAAVAQRLMEAASTLARTLKVEHLELRHRERRCPQWPEQDLYVTFRRPILATEEDNLQAIPRKQRAMVRKGLKNGLRAVVDTDGPTGVDRFFRLYADNVHRHGTPALPRRYFETLRAVFGSDVEVLTVEDSQALAVSTVLSFYFRDEVLPYYAGDRVEARALAANDFKYWELMRRACVQGRTTFDFGRSKRGTGSFDFKKNWGFEPTPLHYEYDLCRRTTVPQNNPNNAKYRLLIQAWRRLPLPVANWLGPSIVRSLG